MKARTDQSTVVNSPTEPECRRVPKIQSSKSGTAGKKPSRNLQAEAKALDVPLPDLDTYDSPRFFAMRPYDVHRAGGGLAALLLCRICHWARHMGEIPDEWRYDEMPRAWLTTYRSVLADLDLVVPGAGPEEWRAAHKRLKRAIDTLVRRKVLTLYPCPPLPWVSDAPGADGRHAAGVRQRLALVPMFVECYWADLPRNLPVSKTVVNAVRRELVSHYGIDEALVLTQLLWRHAINQPAEVVIAGRNKLSHQTGLSAKQIRTALSNLVHRKAVARMRRSDMYEPRSWAIHPWLVAGFAPDKKAVKRRLQKRKELVQAVQTKQARGPATA